MNPYEVAGRERKAARIADHILMCFCEAGGSVEPQPIASLVLELSAAGPGVRASFATGAGTKAPSAQTWLRVIELIGRQGVLAHIELENGRPRPFSDDDPFAGITEADNPSFEAHLADVERRRTRAPKAGLTEVEAKYSRRRFGSPRGSVPPGYALP